MPVCASTGIAPDLIMNPHSLPSRMTVGLLLELVMGKAAAASGCRSVVRQCFGTHTDKLEPVAAALAQYGLHVSGKEMYVCGRTGRMYEATVMTGVAYMYRLKHMAAEKAYARSATGPRDYLTNQPTHGRPKGGGFRFGQMEVDAVISHSAPTVLRDRMSGGDDMCDVLLDSETGLVVQHSAADVRARGLSVHVMRVPRAFALLLSEMQGMNVAMKFSDFKG
jgi:DNA-directed RNA polymerase subunit B